MMPFEIIRNDLANVKADAIVNTANPRPMIGAGTDSAIHQKAGPHLLEARKKIGDIAVGHCAITPAFGLNAKYVIHTVGPVWQDGTKGEDKLLESCFRSALKMAADYNCTSIAFPLISSGTYGFPRQEALQIAIQTISWFLMNHEMKVYLVVWDKESFLLSKGLFQNVLSFIDEHYIEQKQQTNFNRLLNLPFTRRQADSNTEFSYRTTSSQESIPLPPSRSAPLPPLETVSLPSSVAGTSIHGKPTAKSVSPSSSHEIDALCSLDELLENTDAGFTETLLKLIDQTGKKDSEIYKRANVSKQHFSKIRNNPDYKPTKATALAFAIALELDLPQTKDLIGRAGFALTNSSKFDVIIMYFISKKNYNMYDINMTLFQFDQMTLGV